MARTIAEIKKEMSDMWIAGETVITTYELDTSKTFEEQFSKASLESIWFYIVAFAIWVLESLFGAHTDEVDEKIRTKRVHTLGWCRTMALNFQFGGVFKDDITEYDNSSLTDEEIEGQKIITKCSVNVADTDKPTFIFKVAKDSGKLNEDEKTAFKAYLVSVMDPGIHIEVISEDPDELVLYLTVRYDAITMGADGVRYLDNKKVVDAGVTEHLQNLVFNGTLYPSLLEQDLMKQSGVRVATIRLAQASIAGQTPADISDKYEPYSGAITIDIENDLHVEYERF